MTLIAVGAHTAFSIGGIAGPETTAAITTNASGSSFAAYLYTGNNANGQAFTITDSKGNTYVRVGNSITDGGGTGSGIIDRYYCANGVGGSGHTCTATNTGTGTMTGWQIFFFEITNGSAAPLDQHTETGGANNDPIPTNSLTIGTVGPSGELLISFIGLSSGTAQTFTEANGFTIFDHVSPTSPNAAIAYKVVSASGTYGASWSHGGGFNFSAVATDSYQGAAVPPNAGALVLAGQSPSLVRGTVLTPNTAKVWDTVRRSLSLPRFHRAPAFA
jgi:hypothetical protein